MHLPRKLETLLFPALVALLLLNAGYKLAGLAWLDHAHSSGAFGPRDDSNGVWPVAKRPVTLEWDYWLRYPLTAAREWGALVPHNGIARVGPEGAPFAVTMLHELRCLDVVRAALLAPLPARDMPATRGCMNYLRQMAICRGDTHLEPYQYASKIDPVDAHPIRRCWDWNAVYDAVEESWRVWEGNGTLAGTAAM
ncbi:hypothetical protein BV25DRAFT_1841934 [Artomyces pyxidatus]|uniref:Uncharacterized protein n=1 Tax=Artomyces pyxidatus TaxID=48021 RepID=A0ACB8SMY6_9AGAM|nr:hypothetical protein BV25DRAFT_1841934 [Artomyces pyxidatus]